jgi:hypothetical protein
MEKTKSLEKEPIEAEQENQNDPDPAPKKVEKTKKSFSDSKAYQKTIAGRLKLKGVDLKTKKYHQLMK